MLRGGAFKPRTSPYAFQGLGDEALEILVEAREETGLPLVTELMDPRHVEAVVEVADVIQIGARNMSNFSLLSEVGRAPKPVLLKRGLSSTVEDLLMAAEYIVKEGNSEVILCERGIKTFETSTRFTLDIGAIPVLKHGDAPARDRRPVASGRAGATSCCRSRAPPSPRAPTGSSSRCTRGPRRRSATRPQQIPTSDFPRVRRRDPRARVPHGPHHRVRGRAGGQRRRARRRARGQVDLAPRRPARRARRGGDARAAASAAPATRRRRCDAMRALGVEVEDVADDELVVHGVGLRGLRARRRSTARTRGR